jgi:hypothetical protein
LCGFFAKIAALFRKLKPAICLFSSRYADLFDSAFLLEFLEIADFIFCRSVCGYYPTLLCWRLYIMRLRRKWGAAPYPASGLLASARALDPVSVLTLHFL